MNRNQQKTLVLGLIAALLGIGQVVTDHSRASTFAGAWLTGFGTCMCLGVLIALRRKAPAKPVQETLDKSTEGVSPVIGVILMVAITVVLAAIVFVLVSNLGEGVDQAPRLSMLSDGHGNFTVQHVDDGVAWSDLLIGPGATCMPTEDALSHEFVEAGDLIECEGDRLTVVHRPTHTVIYDH